MVYRKTGIGPLSIFKLYYKVQSLYKPNHFSNFIWKTAKQIKDKSIEISIEQFLNKNRYINFNDNIGEINEYFSYCFTNNYPIYFNNLGQHIESWKKYKMKGSKVELQYLFANKVISYLKENGISFKQYLALQKRYVPLIIQHYIADKEIPFEVILYLKALDRCDIDNKKLKMLLHKEYIEMKVHEQRLVKLKSIIQSELEKILEWEKNNGK